MDISFQIEISQAVQADLTRTIEDATARIVRSIAEDAPEEMRLEMSVTGGRSSRGEAPHRQTGYLARSLRGTVTSPTQAEIEMADYAQYLDPLFGGNLDRPFAEAGITRAIAKSIENLQTP